MDPRLLTGRRGHFGPFQNDRRSGTPVDAAHSRHNNALKGDARPLDWWRCQFGYGALDENGNYKRDWPGIENILKEEV